MFSGATRPVVTPSAMNTRGRWSAACIQVVTTLARTGPIRRWRRWSAKPVQAASSHQLMSAKAMTAPRTALMAMDGSEARATTGAAPARTKAVARAAPGSATNATRYQRGLTRNRNTRLRSSRTPLRPSARAVVTKAAMTRDIADRRMNGAAPGRSRSMTPMPALDRKGMAKMAAVAV